MDAQIDIATIVVAMFGASGIVTVALLARRTGREANVVAADTAETQSRAQLDEATGNLIKRQTDELSRMADRITALEAQVAGLQKALESSAAKDKLIETLTGKVDELTRQLVAQQTLINQYAAARIVSPPIAGPAGPTGPAGEPGIPGPAGPPGEPGREGNNTGR